MISLSPERSKQIKSIIERMFDRSVHDLLGTDIFGKKKVIMFSQGKPSHEIIKLFVTALGNKEPNKVEREALKHIISTTQTYIESLKNKTIADTLSTINGLINQKDGISNKALVDSIQDNFEKTANHLKAIVNTQMTTTRNVANALTISKVGESNGVEDPIVYFVLNRTGNTTCKHCVANHLLSDQITPKVFKLSEVGYEYLTHADRELGKVSLSGQHVHCFTESQMIHTDSGIFTFKNLYEQNKQVNVVVDNIIRKRIEGIYAGTYTIDKHTKYGSRIMPATHVYDTGTQECLRITLSSGHSIEVTEDHEMWEVLKDGGQKTKAKDLLIGARIPLLSGNSNFGNDSFEDLAELMGNLMGDGNLCTTAQWIGFGNDIPYLRQLYQKAKPFMQNTVRKKELTIFPANNKYNVPRVGFNSIRLCKIFKKEFNLSKKPRRIPKRLWSATEKTQQAFIRGLFAADGCIERGRQRVSIVLSQNDLDFMKEIQLLLSGMGYISRIYIACEEHDSKIKYSDGSIHMVHRKKCWRLHISGYRQCSKFFKEIGMGVPIKNVRLESAINAMNHAGSKNIYRTSDIISIEKIGKQQTYCITEPQSNTITVNGIVTGQCKCALTYLPPGFSFKNGSISWKGLEHNEYNEQRK
jgi:intein/homing endonuclease